MQVETFTYTQNDGWSVKNFPDLDSKNTLILAFCAPEFLDNHVPLNDLKQNYPNSLLTGCSTAGEICNENLNDHSVSVAVIKFEKTNITMASTAINDANESSTAGKILAQKLAKDDLKGVLVFSDGLFVNGSALLEGLKMNLNPNVVITGGLAGDGSNFKKTFVLKNEKPTTGSITAIGLYGNNIELGYGSKGGWDRFGHEKLITRSKGNILYEIDGEPALDLYKKYLGDRAKDLPSSGLLFPLAISEKSLSDKQVVRTILAIDEKEKSITFAGNIPQNWYAHFMKANLDRLIEGAAGAGQLAKNKVPAPNKSIAIAISCVGRRLVLGQRSEEEIEATINKLGKNTSLIGFYSYGEISPSGVAACDLHNQTMTVTTLGEQ